MNNDFIPSSVYRNYMQLLLRMIDLPSMLALKAYGSAEQTIFHKMVLVGDTNSGLYPPTIMLTSYVVNPEPSDAPLITVNPEAAFYRHGEFWIGSTQRVFKDFNPMVEKQYGKKSWLVSHERTVNFTSFTINENEKLFEISIPMTTLDMLSQIDDNKVLVGSVDEDGNFTPNKESVSATPPPLPVNTEWSERSAVLKKLKDLKCSNTVSDAPVDVAPLAAKPSFLRGAASAIARSAISGRYAT